MPKPPEASASVCAPQVRAKRPEGSAGSSLSWGGRDPASTVHPGRSQGSRLARALQQGHGMRLLTATLSLSLTLSGCAALEGATVAAPARVSEMTWHDELVSLAVSVEGRGVVTMQRERQCGRSTCLYEVDPGTVVVLEAAADPKMRFVEWAGSCAGREPVCRFQAHRGELVVARFEPIADTTDRLAARSAAAVAQRP